MEKWTDEVTAALERLDVADTLEELRHHIDALIDRLSKPEAGEAEPPKSHSVGGLDRQIDDLGHKVESASSMLAELTDLLESQSERIETIERQLGDPDAAPAPQPGFAPEAADVSRLVRELGAEVHEIKRQREWLDARLERFESHLERMDRVVDALDAAARAGLDARTAQSRSPAASGPSKPAATAETARHGYAPARQEPREDVDFDAPLDAATARRLESLVEREIKLQHEFAPGAQGRAGMRSGRATVMVVDDSADARTVLSIYLSRTGYQVVTASSAEDCLAKLRHHNIDAVVLDATMPGGGGEHFLRVLHGEQAYRDRAGIPVIVYTAHPETLSRERARDLGAADYLIKGGDMLPLLTTLVRHLTPEAAPAPGSTGSRVE